MIGLEWQKCDVGLSSVPTFLYVLVLQQRSSFNYGLELYNHILNYNVSGLFRQYKSRAVNVNSG